MSFPPPQTVQEQEKLEFPRRKKAAAIVKELEITGPNMAEIARRIGEPESSIRYFYKSQILKNGYRLVPLPNLQALRLKRFTLIVDIDPRYAESPIEIAAGMDDYWFLDVMGRTFPDGKFRFQFVIPEEHAKEFPAFVRALRRAGLITTVHKTLSHDWRRHRPMRAELFEFRKGKWGFDWSQLSSEGIPAIPKHVRPAKVDSTDLKLLELLQVHGAKTVGEIAKLGGMPLRTAYRHWGHVNEGGMIQWWRILWMRAHVDERSGKPLRTYHQVLAVSIYGERLTRKELSNLSEKMNQLPFLWAEAGGRDYYAQLLVPLEQANEALAYLLEALKPLKNRAGYILEDSSCAVSATLPVKTFNDSKGRWTFDIPQMEVRLRKVLQEYRKRHQRQASL